MRVPPRGEQVPIDNQVNLNDAIPPQVSQAPQVPNVDSNLYNVEIRNSFTYLPKLIMKLMSSHIM